jgi:hypothetical protein
MEIVGRNQSDIMSYDERFGVYAVAPRRLNIWRLYQVRVLWLENGLKRLFWTPVLRQEDNVRTNGCGRHGLD